VNVRLLLDENLSERLLPLLSDRFPDSSHVRQIGLGGADDLVISEQARSQGALLVTKDEDFLRLSVTRGFPPKVICLAIGNAGNPATAALLVDHAEAIEAFSIHPEAGFLLLKPGGQAS
jgi:predicted nuclease of predicted toxin-antitoxin system